MNDRTRRTVRASLRALLVAALLPLAADAGQLRAQDPAQAMLIAEGASVYGNMCGRCHNPRAAAERGDRDWRTIIAHMRVRGNLTGSQVRSVLAFLQATNGDTGPVGGLASADETTETTEERVPSAAPEIEADATDVRSSTAPPSRRFHLLAALFQRLLDRALGDGTP